MLRRRLLLILGSLVAMMVVLALVAVWMLQGVMTELGRVHTEAMATVQQMNRVSSAIANIETELYELQAGRERHLDALIESIEESRKLLMEISQSGVVNEADCQPIHQRVQEAWPKFDRDVALLATAQDPDLARQHNQTALRSAVSLNRDILEMGGKIDEHAQREQQEVTVRFRWLVLGLAIGFLVLINVSIIVLLRTAQMVLKPVDQLVEASRQLAQEHFEHRVVLKRDDEFAVLGNAYNSLAGQLQANEQRRLELLGQVAVTLNHELKNAIQIIELQLQLMGRQANSDNQEKCLRQIQESLRRMTDTVDSLKRIRRIELTEYVVAGEQMLVLPQPVEDHPSAQVRS